MQDGLQDAHVGDRVWFDDEKQAYTIRAVSADRRWMICTKPFNPRRTVLYCVLDRREQRRGPDDHFGLGSYETEDEIASAMAAFEGTDPTCRPLVSVRRDVRLHVAKLLPR